MNNQQESTAGGSDSAPQSNTHTHTQNTKTHTTHYHTNTDIPLSPDATKVRAFLAAWSVNPPQEAGANNSSVRQLPRSIDEAKQSGCRTSRQTSWNSASHAYIVEFDYNLAPQDELHEIMAGIDLELAAPNSSDIALPLLACEGQMSPRPIEIWRQEWPKMCKNLNYVPPNDGTCDRIWNRQTFLCWTWDETLGFDTTVHTPEGGGPSTNPIEVPMPPRWRKLAAPDKLPNSVTHMGPEGTWHVNMHERATYGPERTRMPGPNPYPPRPKNVSEEQTCGCPGGKCDRGQPKPNPKKKKSTARSPYLLRSDGIRADVVAGECPALGEARGTQVIETTWTPVRRVNIQTMRVNEMLGERASFSPAMNGLTEVINSSTDGQRIPSLARGVTIRDGAAIVGLVRAVLMGQDCWKDVAPLVRVLLMGYQTSDSAVSIDNTLERFCHDLNTNSGGTIYIEPRAQAQPYTNITGFVGAMALDEFLFVAQNREYWLANGMNERWSYSRLDQTWVAVPIDAGMLAAPYCVPYIASFLSHRYWYGRTTWRRECQGIAGVYPNIWANEIPHASVVELEGAYDVMLVIVDATNQTLADNIQLANHLIPTFRGPIQNRAAAYDGVNFVAIFDAWFSQANVGRVTYDCAYAFNNLCTRLAVDDTCGRALALAGELSQAHTWGKMIVQNNQGDVPAANNSSGLFCFNPANTAWPPRAGILATPFTTHANANHCLNGFNTGNITPFHRPVSAAAEIHMTAQHHVMVGAPQGYASHNCYQSSSLMRLATYIGLLTSHEQTYRIESGEGLTNMVKNIGTGIALSMASLLVQADVGMKEWLGLCTNYNSETRHSLETAVHDWTSYHCLWLDTREYEAAALDWQDNTYLHLDTYWPMPGQNSCVDSLHWATNSPVPYLSYLQWKPKCGNTQTYPKATRELLITETALQVSAFQIQDHTYRADAAASIDIQRLVPHGLIRTAGFPTSGLCVWCEQWARVTTDTLTALNTPLEREESAATNTFVMSTKQRQYTSIDFNIMLWNDSPAATEPGERTTASANRIQYPDPPDMDTFLRQAYRYLVDPALSGALGFVAGGPAGAAIGAGTALAKTALSDIKKAVENAPLPAVVEETQEAKRNNPTIESALTKPTIAGDHPT